MLVCRPRLQSSLFALCILPLCNGELSRRQGRHGAIEACPRAVAFYRFSP